MMKSLTFQISPKFKDENRVGLSFLSGPFEATIIVTPLQQWSAWAPESDGLGFSPGSAT